MAEYLKTNDIEKREADFQTKLVSAVGFNLEETARVAALSDEILESSGYRFTSTQTPIFPYSVIPTVISSERHDQYVKADSAIDNAAWKIICQSTVGENALIFSGFRPVEKRMVEDDLQHRIVAGLSRRMFRRIDRLGGSENYLTGLTNERQIIEENSNSPDGGAYQKALATAYNETILPHLRNIAGVELPDMPVMWELLHQEILDVSRQYGRDKVQNLAIIYLESGHHIAKDIEMPLFAKFLSTKGIDVHLLTQHNMGGTNLQNFDVIFKAFDTSHKLSDSGNSQLAERLNGLPVIGSPSEVVFGAKALMGVLSRAARTNDERLNTEEKGAILSGLGWKEAILPGYQETVITPQGEEMHWKDFLRTYGHQIYLKQNIGGSGYAVLRIGGNEIGDEDQLISAAELALEESALEIEGMVSTPTRNFAVQSIYGLQIVEGASDYTEYWVGGQPANAGFGRLNIVAGKDDPRVLKNITQGAVFSPLMVVPKI